MPHGFSDQTGRRRNDVPFSPPSVLASSTASELSQESEALRASYFTHHLLSGLRGAADADRDGRVTLSEAYRYAYNRTLVATAATAPAAPSVCPMDDLVAVTLTSAA